MIRTLAAIAFSATSLLAVGPTPASGSASGSALDDTPWHVPVPPERCAAEQADSGDVAGCVLISYPDPSTSGWGVPPAPGVGSGWNWLGYTYNGSPALTEWESTQIVANSEPVAGFRSGSISTHRDAQALFEGFLDEISANGYRVRSVSGYSFRCTNSTGGWSCPSGDPDDLSNHAWGLAIDMNAGTNPIRRYSGVDGQTACQTPMQTDLPKWVIETAERWGLYWGGYGWSSGCPTTTAQQASVYRDPPHFEFRGTPAQALAIANHNLGNDPDRRCWTTVTDEGETVERCNTTGLPEAGWRLPIEVDAPEGAVAVLINLTAAGSAAAGHLTLESCQPVPHERSTSTVNFGPGENAAAMAIAPLDDGRFCVYRFAAAHSIVDVMGFLTESGERWWYRPTTPTRVIDTRLDSPCSVACEPTRVGAGQLRAVPTTDGAPRIVNLTVDGALGPGHARAGRCDTMGTADVSNVNYVPGAARANLTLLGNGPDGACAWVFRDTHVIVDELGRLDPDEGLGWRVATTRRALDTRLCTDNWCGARPGNRTAFAIDLGVDAPGAAITLTVTDAEAPGHAWAGACDELVEGQPTTSNVNYVPGKATANMAIVSPVDGKICVYVHSAAHVVVDVQAELVPQHDLGLRPVDPHRVHDSRTT